MTESKQALIVVDVLEDFCPGGALPVTNGHEVVEVANYLTSKNWFKVKILLQDWHPKGHCSFASSHPGKNVFDTVTLKNGTEQILWPDHGEQDTQGAKFHPALNLNYDLVIQKGTDPEIDSYSGFWDNAQMKETDLFRYLNENDITDVFVMGLATDYCVKFTVIDSVNLGFNTYVIQDGCRAVATDGGEEAFAEMKKAEATLITSDEMGVLNSL